MCKYCEFEPFKRGPEWSYYDCGYENKTQLIFDKETKEWYIEITTIVGDTIFGSDINTAVSNSIEFCPKCGRKLPN